MSKRKRNNLNATKNNTIKLNIYSTVNYPTSLWDTNFITAMSALVISFITLFSLTVSIEKCNLSGTFRVEKAPDL